MENEIKEYFSQFGDVNRIQLHHEGDLHCGYVEFKTVDGATTALSTSVHRVANCDVQVKAAEPEHQPDHMLNALDDDCLREIFKYLDEIDLCNAAEVCVRFNQHAKEAISSQIEACEFPEAFRFSVHSNLFEQLLRPFGCLIHSLLIRDNDSGVDTLKMVHKHISSRLKWLTISNLRIHEHLNIHSMFANLETLEIVSGSFLESNLNELLANCSELKILIIRSNDSEEGCFFNFILEENCLNQQFSKLEEAYFLGGSMTNDSLNNFIILNSSLKKLALRKIFLLSAQDLLPIIGQHLHSLSYLEINQYSDGCIVTPECLLSLGKLLSLNGLQIHLNSLPVAPLLNELATKRVPIELLVLSRDSDDSTELDTIENILRLKQIKKLYLENIHKLTDDQTIKLAMELTQLQELYLEGYDTINITSNTLKRMLPFATSLSKLQLKSANNLSVDVDDYNEMLKTIQNRPQKIHLSIEVESHKPTINVPESILEENRNWFYICDKIIIVPVVSEDEFDYDSDQYRDWGYNESDHDDY